MLYQVAGPAQYRIFVISTDRSTARSTWIRPKRSFWLLTSSHPHFGKLRICRSSSTRYPEIMLVANCRSNMEHTNPRLVVGSTFFFCLLYSIFSRFFDHTPKVHTTNHTMTLWESFLPSYRGMMSSSTKWPAADASPPPPKRLRSETISVSPIVDAPAQMTKNSFAYSMVQPQPLGLDEQVGWATYLEYI